MKWLRKQLAQSENMLEAVAIGIGIGIVFGIVYDVYFTPIVEVAHAEVIEEEAVEPIEVQIEVVYTREDKIRIIRSTFPETPNTAVAVAMAEGGREIPTVRQSDYYKDGVREPSFCAFQIHEPSWMRDAVRLGYGDYKTNFLSCVKMARHVYEVTGYSWSHWSAYTNGSYRVHL